MVVPSMEVAGAAEIGVIDDHVVRRRFAVGPVGDDRADALVGERADGDGAGSDDLGAFGRDILEQAQDAQAGAEALLGMRPVGQDDDNKPLRVGALWSFLH